LPPGYPLPPLDANGRRIAAGDLVSISSIPEWLVRDLPAEEVAQLRACEGTAMRVLEIDHYGHLWFGSDSSWFSLQPCEVDLQSPRTNDT
jgi:hypothetical protein